ncbi:MAG: ABC transporter ATP-binding protein, partial [Actinobacteria bacterium]|nr:ABC transporter ATP-binding protein [Actinomycetota bacterium]
MMHFIGPRSEARGRRSRRERLRELASAFGNTPRVFGMVWRTSPGLAVAFSGLTLAQSLIPAATIWVTKLLVDAVVAAIGAGGTEGSIRSVVWLVVLQLALAVGSSLLQHGGQAVRAMLGDQFSNRVNMMILEKAEALDLSYFENPKFYDTLENARREANFRPVGVVTQTFQLGSSIIRLVSVVGLLAALAWWIVLVVLVTSIPYLATEYRFAQRNFGMMTRRAPESRLLWYLGYVMTSDETVKEVRLFDLGGHLLQRYRETFAKFYRENRALTLSRESVAFGLAVVSAVASSGIYVFVALATIAGRLTLGDLTLYHQAFVQTQSQIQAVFGAIAQIYESNLFLTN